MESIFEKTIDTSCFQNVSSSIYMKVSPSLSSDIYSTMYDGPDSGLGSLECTQSDEIKGYHMSPTGIDCFTPNKDLSNSPRDFVPLSDDSNHWSVDESSEPLSKKFCSTRSSENTQLSNSVTSSYHDQFLSVFSSSKNLQADCFNCHSSQNAHDKDKINQQRTIISLNPNLVTEEATLGDSPTHIGDSSDLAQMQSVLRAIIREIGQTSPQEVASKEKQDTVADNTSVSIDASSLINSKVNLKHTTSKSSINGSFSRKDTNSKRPMLCSSFPSRRKNGEAELKILSQPEEQHRARYLTEGSRGAVKDRSGTSFPTVKLFGYDKPVTLQVYIGTDQGRVQPHLFYQASKVCGKNSTQCFQKKIDGTTVLEIAMLPEKDMTVSCDCVGILKERNVDVEKRLLQCGGSRSKKRSTRCRIVFRVSIPIRGNSYETLQVTSAPILCTQPPGVPEICKKSLSSCSVKGGEELFIIGKNFLKDTKVIFLETKEEKSLDEQGWKVAVEPEKEYLQPTHILCTIPPFYNQNITSGVSVQLTVTSGGRASEPQTFTYIPCSLAQNEEWIKSAPENIGSTGHSGVEQAAPQVPVPAIIQMPLLPASVTTVSSVNQPMQQPKLLVIPATGTTVFTAQPIQPLTTISMCDLGNNTQSFGEKSKTGQLQLLVIQTPEGVTDCSSQPLISNQNTSTASSSCGSNISNLKDVLINPKCTLPSFPLEMSNATTDSNTKESINNIETNNLVPSEFQIESKNKILKCDSENVHPVSTSDIEPIQDQLSVDHIKNLCIGSTTEENKGFIQDYSISTTLGVDSRELICENRSPLCDQSFDTRCLSITDDLSFNKLDQDQVSKFSSLGRLQNKQFSFCAEQSVSSPNNCIISDNLLSDKLDLPWGNQLAMNSVESNLLSDSQMPFFNKPKSDFNKNFKNNSLNSALYLNEQSHTVPSKPADPDNLLSESYSDGMVLNDAIQESCNLNQQMQTYPISEKQAKNISGKDIVINSIDTLSFKNKNVNNSTQYINCQEENSQRKNELGMDQISEVSWMAESELLKLINPSTFDNGSLQLSDIMCT